MNNSITTIAALLTLTCTPIAQAPAKEAASRATHELEQVQRHLTQLQERVAAALRKAESAKEAADKEEGAEALQDAVSEFHGVVTEVQQQLDSAEEKLAAAHKRISVLAPSKVAAALAAQRQAFDQALSHRDPKKAEDGYQAVEKALAAPLFAGAHDAARLKAIATFKRAEVMVRRGYRKQRGRARAQGEKLLKAAVKVFDKLVDGPDFEGDWGSSLHATALQRAIRVHGSFYLRYIKFKDDPRVWARLSSAARENKDKADVLFEELSRVHVDAWAGPNRSRVVDLARADIARLFETPLPPTRRGR